MKNEFLSKVFNWFGLGLLVTFITAFLVSTNLTLLSLIFGGIGYIVIIILEIVLAIWLTTRIRKMDSGLTKVLYIGYSALTGLTLSSIFIIYQLSSIIFIFLVSAIIFFIFAMIGKKTNIDLRKMGGILIYWLT